MRYVDLLVVALPGGWLAAAGLCMCCVYQDDEAAAAARPAQDGVTPP